MNVSVYFIYNGFAPLKTIATVVENQLGTIAQCMSICWRLINFELTTSNTKIKLPSFELKYKMYVNGSLTSRLTVIVTDKIAKNVQI